LSTLNFFGGSLVLLISAAVFGPIYLLGANLCGLIEDDEKELVRKYVRRLLPGRRTAVVADS